MKEMTEQPSLLKRATDAQAAALGRAYINMCLHDEQFEYHRKRIRKVKDSLSSAEYRVGIVLDGNGGVQNDTLRQSIDDVSNVDLTGMILLYNEVRNDRNRAIGEWEDECKKYSIPPDLATPSYVERGKKE